MMASQQTKLHDPMYSFDTHFPERLSRLHLHSEAPASFRKKKSRAQRNNARYKTQPVTFDEIKEVDEEPVPEEKLNPEKLMGKLQAFSKSMDGLIPRTAIDHGHFHLHGSHSRSGSRKFHRHPECIPEKVEAEQQTQQQQQQQQPENQKNEEVSAASHSRLPSLHQPSTQQDVGSGSASVSASASVSMSSPTPTSLGQSSASPEVESEDVIPPVTPTTNMAPRRQKVTAKAKKRQKASEEGQQG